MSKKILVVGGGGREHAIIKALKKSPDCGEVWCAPGNGGIGYDAHCVNIKATDVETMVGFAETEKFDYVVVAQDDPLALGMVDALAKVGIPAFGPDKAAARIEASKVFSKDLMKKYGIPTAKYETFDDPAKVMEYIKAEGKYPVVIKADGLALGKGVLICENEEQAAEGVKEIMLDKKFGASGNHVVVEEFLTGPEVSVLSFTDGKVVKPMVSSMDHKRALDGDEARLAGAGSLLVAALAILLQAFGVKTFGVCRRTSPDRPGFDRLVRLDEAETLLPAADFVLGAMPQSPERAGWLSAEHLALLPQDAVVVNVGRGSFLDADALARELQSGHLFGAGLDVTDPEPLPAAHPLWSLPNCILTPHVAGVSFGHLPQTEERIWRICAENLERYAAGDPLRNLVREIPL